MSSPNTRPAVYVTEESARRLGRDKKTRNYLEAYLIDSGYTRMFEWGILSDVDMILRMRSQDTDIHDLAWVVFDNA